jgi:hypothetical protein
MTKHKADLCKRCGSHRFHQSKLNYDDQNRHHDNVTKSYPPLRFNGNHAVTAYRARHSEFQVKGHSGTKESAPLLLVDNSKYARATSMIWSSGERTSCHERALKISTLQFVFWYLSVFVIADALISGIFQLIRLWNTAHEIFYETSLHDHPEHLYAIYEF